MRVFALAAAVVAMAALVSAAAGAPLVQARTAAGGALDVTFTADGAITMTLPDGTPVGTTSGAPTTIPAGAYVIYLQGPDGCVDLPFFMLKGPGENIVDNLSSGASTNSYNANFVAGSTYTWFNDSNPKAVYSFTAAGASSSSGTSSSSSSSSGSVSSGSVSGGSSSSTGHSSSTQKTTSTSASTLGTLVGAVSSSGRLTLSLGGKSVKKLAPGKYKVSVVDKSSTGGFVLALGKHVVTVTSGKFVGKHTATVSLTGGRWLFVTKSGGKPVFAVTVS
jgi:hypothetical protein